MVIFEDKKFNYTIVLPEKATAQEKLAATELEVFFRQACGKTIETIKDSQTKGKTEDLYLFIGKPLRRQFVRTVKYIFIGNTKETLENGFVVKSEDVTPSGYVMKTFEGDVFINGASGYGTIYGVYDFLKATVGFEVYTHDEIHVDKKQTIEFPETDVTFKPYVAWREPMSCFGIYSGIAKTRMRYHSMANEVFASEWGGPHTSFKFFPPSENIKDHPEWYNDTEKPEQLCYTAHGDEKSLNLLREKTLEQMKKSVSWHLKQGDLAPYISFTAEDNDHFCNCEKCAALEKRYGATAGAIIQFLNPIAEELNAWLKPQAPDKKVNIVFYAYTIRGENAPVKKNKAGEYEAIDDSVKMSKYLSVWYAPYWADYGSSFYEETNEPYYDVMKRWSAISSDMLFWGYGGLGFCMRMYDTFEVMFDSYKIVKDFNISYYFDQGMHNEQTFTNFGDFLRYLNSKLLWDLEHQDYKTLRENFFDNYYGLASQQMQTIFEEVRKHCAYMRTLGYRFACNYHDYMSRKHWTKKQLEYFIKKFDEAFDAIEPLRKTQPCRYRQIFDRISREKVVYTYMWLELYQDEIDREVLLAERDEWKAEMLRLGFKRNGEGTPVYTLWEDWK